MEKLATSEKETTTYNREVTRMMAKEEALDKLSEVMLESTERRIEAIQKLIDELTEEPVNNEHRHVVEQLAILLSTEKAQAEFDKLMTRLGVEKT